MCVVWCVMCVDVEGALSRALLVGNFETAVDICIGDGRMVSIHTLTHTHTHTLTHTHTHTHTLTHTHTYTLTHS